MNSGLNLSFQDELNLQPGTSHPLLLFSVLTSPRDLEVMFASRSSTACFCQTEQVQLLVMTPSQAR